MAPPSRRPRPAPALAGGLLLLGALACHAPRNPLAVWAPSPNFNARRPQLVVLHHTAGTSFESALETLRTRNDGGPVSSHYLIGRDGRIAQLVADDHRAWHAGTGTWGPYRDINSLSIGIELDNSGFEPFPPAQVDALLVLLEDLTRRHRIPRAQVVGHADVEPVLKEDPSAFFPWKRLAGRGFGLWPGEVLEEPPPGFDPHAALVLLGYALKDRDATVRAFRLHYRGEKGQGLDGTDLKILWDLQRQVQRLAAPGLPAPPGG